MRQSKRRRFGSLIRRWSVTAQMMLIITVIVLPINILSLFFTSQAKHTVIKRGEESAIHTAELYISGMDERMRSADSFMMRDVDKNLYCLWMRNSQEGEDFMKNANLYWQGLQERTAGYGEADAYFYYLADKDYGSVAAGTEYQTDRYELTQYISKASELPDNREWYIAEIGGQSWLLHVLQNGSFYYGSAINLDEIAGQIEAALVFDEASVLLTDRREDGERGEKVLTVPSDKGRVYAHIYLNHEELSSNMFFGSRIGIAVAAFYLLLIPGLILLIRKILIAPLQRVNTAMENLKKGDADYRIVSRGGNKETEELNRGFNSMAERLVELKIEVYENKLEKMDIEATNLQLQTNPHFILNSLNIISSMAKLGTVADIIVLTKYLADYLRFSLWHTSGTVSVAEEMQCVHTFLEIQKIRFPGTFTYIEKIDESIKEVPIPSLLVLNFVENTIKYALNMEWEIEIIIIIRRSEDSVLISVCDTGNGMDAETLKSMETGEAYVDHSGKHIGIWNCRRRLNMMYGERAYFHITSQAKMGTQVFIKIPLPDGTEER